MIFGTTPSLSVLIRKAINGEEVFLKSAIVVPYFCLGGAEIGLEWYGLPRGVVATARYSSEVVDVPL